jgi:EAL domain-containing protein (putative c-di-GMP-specific phosphodiesterase class I)
VEAGSRSSALAGAIVALSHSLQIETVAEGIETAAQAARMRDLGCTYGQGYFFAAPLQADELEDELWRSAEADAERAAAEEASARRPRRIPRAVRAIEGAA